MMQWAQSWLHCCKGPSGCGSYSTSTTRPLCRCGWRPRPGLLTRPNTTAFACCCTAWRQIDTQNRPLDVPFGSALTLKSVDIAPSAAQPGDLLRVSTHWFVNQPLPEYKFSLRLANAAGEPVYTVDYVPQNWFAPTNVWVVGQPATDQRGVLLPADLPPGSYQLTLRLYDPATGAPVESSTGQDVLLAELQIGNTQP